MECLWIHELKIFIKSNRLLIIANINIYYELAIIQVLSLASYIQKYIVYDANNFSCFTDEKIKQLIYQKVTVNNVRDGISNTVSLP